MQSKLKSNDKTASFTAPPAMEKFIRDNDPKEFHAEREALKESTKRAQDTMAILKSDNKRLKGLLEEAEVQLNKTNDEYHSELGDKIRLELGLVKEPAASADA